MGIQIRGTNLSSVKIGTGQISRVYVGSNRLWEYQVASSDFFDFTTGTLPAGTTLARGGTNAWFWDDTSRLTRVSAPNHARFEHDSATGTLIGLLLEASAKNELTYSRTLSAGSSEWTGNSITSADNVTGIDGVANKASTLTATGANGTFLAAKILPTDDYTFSAWVRRKTGIGRVDITLDGGATWQEISAYLLGGRWMRVGTHLLGPGGPVTDPHVGFRIVEAGDAIEVDVCQLEAGFFATGEIVTDGTTKTRTAETLRFVVDPGVAEWDFAWPEAAVISEERHIRAVQFTLVGAPNIYDILITTPNAEYLVPGEVLGDLS